MHEIELLIGLLLAEEHRVGDVRLIPGIPQIDLEPDLAESRLRA